MIHGLIMEKVRDGAELLGLPRGRVISKSLSDNMTIPRPRIELDFLPETLTRSGRKLGIVPGDADSVNIKRELYTVSLPIAAQILADDEDWLKEFSYRLIAALPRGFDDDAGNHVKLTATQGEWENMAVRRVGDTVIEPIIKRGHLLHLNALWRITANEREAAELIRNIILTIGGMNHG